MWLAALLAILPDRDVVSDRADIIELNHFYDDTGRLVFDQVIFWRWDAAAGEHHIFAWRLVKTPGQIPQRDWRAGGYRSVWFDGYYLRRVTAPAVRETWTQHDPELDDRLEFAAHERAGLRFERHATFSE